MESVHPGQLSVPANLRVGPAGWTYRDWEGRVYPSPAPRGFDRLARVARLFDAVEVNASFYRIPPARTAAAWLTRVADRPDFRFTVKLHQSLTHQRTLDAGVLHAMREFVRPLDEGGRLGPLLAQFPWSFRPDDAAFAHLQSLRAALGDAPVALEVRHGGWGKPGVAERVGQMGYALVSVDQPQVGDSLPPVGVRTSDVVYVRMHGRNRTSWFAAGAGRDARYDYLYREDELQEWARRILPLAERARATYVVTNNHFEGKAIANALQLRALLGLPVEEVPAELARAYPTLTDQLRARGARALVITTPAATPHRQAKDTGAQRELFG